MRPRSLIPAYALLLAALFATCRQCESVRHPAADGGRESRRDREAGVRAASTQGLLVFDKSRDDLPRLLKVAAEGSGETGGTAEPWSGLAAPHALPGLPLPAGYRLRLRI